MLKQTLKLFFILLGFSVIAVWISNNYGTVDIFWLGYKVHTSVPVFLFVMWLMFILLDKTMWLIGFITKPIRKKKEAKVEKEKKTYLPIFKKKNKESK